MQDERGRKIPGRRNLVGSTGDCDHLDLPVDLERFADSAKRLLSAAIPTLGDSPIDVDDGRRRIVVTTANQRRAEPAGNNDHEGRVFRHLLLP